MTPFKERFNKMSYFSRLILGLMFLWTVVPILFLIMLIGVPGFMVAGTISCFLGRSHFEKKENGNYVFKL